MTSSLVQYLSLTQAPTAGQSIAPSDSVITIINNQLVRLPHADYITSVLGDIPTRLASVENSTGAGAGATVWPVARTMTLTGPVNGSATFDGTSNFTVATSIPDGSLTIAQVTTLGSTLVGLRNDIDALVSSNQPLGQYVDSGSIGSALASVGQIFVTNGSMTSVPTTNGGSLVVGAVTRNTNESVRGAAALYINGPSDFYVGTTSSTTFGSDTWTWNKVWTNANLNPSTFIATNGGTISSGSLTIADGVNFNANGNINFQKVARFYAGGQIFNSGGQRTLDFSSNSDGAGGYDVRFTQQAGLSNVKIWLDVPGHAFKVGTVKGVEYNGNQILHTGIFNPNDKLDSNAAAISAAKWTNPITLSLTGNVTGSASIDGSGNVSLATTIANASLTIAMTSGLQSALDARVRTVNGSGPDANGNVNVGLPANVVTTDQIEIQTAGDYNPNFAVKSGFLSYLVPTANSPGFGYGNGFVSAGGDTVGQIVVDHGTPRMAFRGAHGVTAPNTGTWTPWYTVAVQGQNAAFNNTTHVDITATRGDGSGVLYMGNTGYIEYNTSKNWVFAGNGAGGIYANHVSSSNPDSYRITYGSYGTFWRNDGSTLYLMVTNANDQYGTWNGLRPFMLDLATGSITTNSSWTFTTSVRFSGTTLHYVGAVGTQMVARYIGWNNAVGRWAEVLEPNANYSLYRYDNTGAGLGAAINIDNSTGHFQINNNAGVSGSLGVGRLWTGWDSGVSGAVSCNNWFRTAGDTGIFFSTYGNGIYSTSSGWVRTYNTSSFVSEGRLSSNNYTNSNSAVVGYKNIGGNPSYHNAQLEAISGDGNAVGMSFHRSGYSHANLWHNGASGTFYFGSDGNYHTQVTGSGIWYAADFSSSSDARWKTNIQSLREIKRLYPKRFFNTLTQKVELGVIAQDLEESWPELVGVKEDGSLTVSYSRLVIPVITQVNWIEDEVALVKRRVGVLEKENISLTNEVDRLTEKSAMLERQIAEIFERLNALSQ